MLAVFVVALSFLVGALCTGVWCGWSVWNFLGGIVGFLWGYWCFREFHIFRGGHHVILIENGMLVSVVVYRRGMYEVAPHDPKRAVFHVFSPAAFRRPRIVFDPPESGLRFLPEGDYCKVNAHGEVVFGFDEKGKRVTRSLTCVVRLVADATRRQL